MPKNSFQKGSVEISTFAGMAIIATVVVVISTIAVIKYRETANVTVPAAAITSKSIPSATPTPVVDETADWKTYKNEEYSFEIKYPQDFEGQESETGDILLEATKKDSGGSYYFTIKTRLNYKIDQTFSSVVATAEKIIIGNHSSYKYFYTEGIGESGVVLIQAGQDELTISFDFIGDGQIAKNRKIYFKDFFNQILSTFKFTK